jgi:hypothetical protein
LPLAFCQAFPDLLGRFLRAAGSDLQLLTAADPAELGLDGGGGGAALMLLEERLDAGHFSDVA